MLFGSRCAGPGLRWCGVAELGWLSGAAGPGWAQADCFCSLPVQHLQDIMLPF